MRRGRASDRRPTGAEDDTSGHPGRALPLADPRPRRRYPYANVRPAHANPANGGPTVRRTDPISPAHPSRTDPTSASDTRGPSTSRSATKRKRTDEPEPRRQGGNPQRQPTSPPPPPSSTRRVEASDGLRRLGQERDDGRLGAPFQTSNVDAESRWGDPAMAEESDEEVLNDGRFGINSQRAPLRHDIETLNRWLNTERAQGPQYSDVSEDETEETPRERCPDPVATSLGRQATVEEENRPAPSSPKDTGAPPAYGSWHPSTKIPGIPPPRRRHIKGHLTFLTWTDSEAETEEWDGSGYHSESSAEEEAEAEEAVKEEAEAEEEAEEEDVDEEAEAEEAEKEEVSDEDTTEKGNSGDDRSKMSFILSPRTPSYSSVPNQTELCAYWPNSPDHRIIGPHRTDPRVITISDREEEGTTDGPSEAVADKTPQEQDAPMDLRRINHRDREVETIGAATRTPPHESNPYRELQGLTLDDLLGEAIGAAEEIPLHEGDSYLELETFDADDLMALFNELPALDTVQEEGEWREAPAGWQVDTPMRRVPQTLIEAVQRRLDAESTSRTRTLEIHGGQRFRISVNRNREVRVFLRPSRSEEGV
ncbi:retinitis pigmentosa 1-like 1 protein [Drosophila obscura]|uniref:retinitis pigmentosa 1-like 1 protein n=1 Tax=Drosophila obscura TaxID=7282 RepID=UPI001BB0E3DE|nr:retinitis pigmentosa 1-like 1 protein [Drosophila obscura]